MRFTVTFDKDAAARLKRLSKTRPFEALVNDALRLGLEELESDSPASDDRYSIATVEGHPLRKDLDNVAELIAEVEVTFD